MESESQAGIATAVWTAPQCPFSIEYSARTLDDIRLAVMDAFFSLPRGGAEIGGILLGQLEGGKLLISGHIPLDCEHAFGPSFTLSAPDEQRFAELLRQASAGPAELRPVGWYHSHTRSEIFLSDTDQALHHRYFPESWQVALVFKPHTFLPMRCGFFFREPDGSMRCDAPCQEFQLEALPMRTMPSRNAPPLPRDAALSMDRPNGNGHGSTITVEATAAALEPAPEPAPEPVREPEAPLQLGPPPPPIAPPAFLEQKESRSRLKPLIAAALVLAFAGAMYETRDQWMFRFQSHVKPVVTPPPPPSLGLSTVDNDGQLQIRWDSASPSIRQAKRGALRISDGSAGAKEVPLEPAHLMNGSYTFARESGQVDVLLTVEEPNGQEVRAMSGFVGKLPTPTTAPDNALLRKQRDTYAAEATKLKMDILRLQKSSAEAARLKAELGTLNQKNKALEQQLKDQQRKRLGNQVSDR